MSALTVGLTGVPLVLIQGLPGRGRPRTIVSLPAVILHAADS